MLGAQVRLEQSKHWRENAGKGGQNGRAQVLFSHSKEFGFTCSETKPCKDFEQTNDRI